MKKAYLVLSNGRVFEGQSIGAEGNTLGEMVFTTGVVGYLETLTDPNYKGQIVVQTFPLIGNYGVIDETVRGKKCTVSGYVVREMCDAPSNFRCGCDLESYLKAQGICAICGVDTREITAILRDEGVMNAMICTELPADMEKITGYNVTNAIRQTGATERRSIASTENKYKAAVIDYGKSEAIIDALIGLGCSVEVYPHDAACSAIIADGCDGIVLSDGPDSPIGNDAYIAQVKAVVESGKPVLGIGLGHQLIALAMGGSVSKLKYGHRGGNQPVRDMKTGRTYITSQNHGYSVDADSLKDVAAKAFVNANDGACEGLVYNQKKILSLQFMPDMNAGARDAGYILADFAAMMGGMNDAQR